MFEWYATEHDGPDPELARLQGDRPGFALDVGCGTGLGHLDDQAQRQNMTRLARTFATTDYGP